MIKRAALTGAVCLIALISGCGEEGEPGFPSGEQYILWTFQAGDGIGQSPWVENGRVYLSSYDGIIYCLDAGTGRQIWTFQTGDRVVVRPTVADGKVYVGSYDERFYCLNAENGKLEWRYDDADGSITTNACVHDDRVFFGDTGGTFHCVKEGGIREWRANLSSSTGLFSNPCADSDYVYVVGYWHTYCFRTRYGVLNWKYDTGQPNFSSPCVEQGRVYVGGTALFCLDALNGAEIWRREVRNEMSVCYCRPNFANNKVYVGDYEGYVSCLTADGKLIWENKLAGIGYEVSSRPLIHNGKVYVGSKDGGVYCLDDTDGKILWAYETGGQIVGDPWFYDGKMYIGSGDGKLYCFRVG